jgi:hypothetical protein
VSSQEFEGVGEGGEGVAGAGDGLDGRGGAGGGGSSSDGTGALGAAGDHSGRGDEVAGYAAEVRAQFADLPEAESADLLEDLEDHLQEVAAEDAGTLRARLGAPAAYARELRQAAGLPEPGEGSGSGGPGAGSRSRRSLRAVVRDAMADAERWARGYRAGREVLDFLPSLRPAWWVLRAWAAVRLLEVMTTSVDPWHGYALIPQVGDSTFSGLVALLIAIPVSVYAARRTVPDGWRRRAVGAGEGILVLFTVGMALSAIGNQGEHVTSSPWQVSYAQQAPPNGLVDYDKTISNLYVYDQSGKLLNGVFVYDQDGMPVSVSGTFLDRGAWLDGNGALIPNLFPRQFLEPQWNSSDGGTRLVTVPPPTVNIPQGVHRAPFQGDQQQDSATAPPSTPAPPTSSEPAPGTSTSSPSPTTSPSGAAGAQTSSALPSTPTPPAATH